MDYVYVLLSLKDGKFYTGYTENLDRRIEEHTNGVTASTKFRQPFELIYYEASRNRSEFLKEREMKSFRIWTSCAG